MNDLDSRLRNHMRHEAGSASLPAGSLAGTVARGRQRRRRARIATSGLLVAATVGGALGSVAWLDSRDDRSGADMAIAAGTSAGDGSSTDGAATAGELAPLEFRRTDAVDRLGFVRSVVTSGDGVVYALSTAPGTTDTNVDGRHVAAPQAVYRAREGGGWDAVALGDDLRLQGLAMSANRLYGVGTAPAAADLTGGEAQTSAVVAWSDDGGATWSQSSLPIRPDGLDPSIETWVGDATVAAGDAGVVAVLTTWAELDIESRLPDGTDLDYGYRAGPDGVMVFGPPASVSDDQRRELTAQLCAAGWTFDVERVACVAPDTGEIVQYDPIEAFSGFEPAATYGWEELGLSPEVGRLVDGLPQLFHSADGETFQPVTDALPHDGAAFGHQVVATPDGFLAAAHVYDTSGRFGYFGEGTAHTVLWRSADGVSWTPIESPTSPDLEWAMTSGRVGDRLAMVGHGAGGAIVATTADGSDWSSTDPTDLVSTDAAGPIALQHAAIGAGGIAVTMQEHIDPVASAGGIDIAVDGYTLRILDSEGRAVLLDGAGAEVVAVESIWELQGQPAAAPAPTTPPRPDDTVAAAPAGDAALAVIADPETGETLVEVPYDALWAPFEESMLAAESDGGAPGRAWVAWSPDGRTWSTTDITAELTDGGMGLRGIYVGAATITVELGVPVESADAVSDGVESSRTLVAPIPG